MRGEFELTSFHRGRGVNTTRGIKAMTSVSIPKYVLLCIRVDRDPCVGGRMRRGLLDSWQERKLMEAGDESSPTSIPSGNELSSTVLVQDCAASYCSGFGYFVVVPRKTGISIGDAFVF